jgi:hypothetical protein
MAGEMEFVVQLVGGRLVVDFSVETMKFAGYRRAFNNRFG